MGKRWLVLQAVSFVFSNTKVVRENKSMVTKRHVSSLKQYPAVLELNLVEKRAECAPALSCWRGNQSRPSLLSVNEQTVAKGILAVCFLKGERSKLGIARRDVSVQCMLVNAREGMSRGCVLQHDIFIIGLLV